MLNDQVAQWILDRMDEKYYSTTMAKSMYPPEYMVKAQDYLNSLLVSHKNSFIETDEGYLFGSGAVLTEGSNKSFVTTSRGKNELEDYAFVSDVDHDKRKVWCATPKKASLNAPLFDKVFKTFKDVKYILHFHHQRVDLATVDYATPGTDKDSQRVMVGPSFNIEGHGCILSYNRIGELLK
jgi:ribulose-5-phosphate 4-epimerase/fuculose-1-phosphate aldolase